ncbi:MAG: hypothetical protein NDI61_05450 [Bdellovibrionaceae bacterium]|nr:hypothetical protein [Pseudobdellovibrionaceae bacterium]
MDMKNSPHAPIEVKRIQSGHAVFAFTALFLMTACGTHPTPSKSSVNLEQDISTTLVAEADLQGSGCAFLRNKKLRLQCANTQTQQRQYQQLVAATKYLIASDAVKSGSQMNPATELSVVEKRTVITGYLVNRTFQELREPLRMPENINTVMDLEDEHYDVLELLAANHHIFIEMTSDNEDESISISVDMPKEKMPNAEAARRLVTKLNEQLQTYQACYEMTDVEKANWNRMHFVASLLAEQVEAL